MGIGGSRPGWSSRGRENLIGGDGFLTARADIPKGPPTVCPGISWASAEIFTSPHQYIYVYLHGTFKPLRAR